MSIFSERAFLHLQTHTPFPVKKGARSRNGFFPSRDPSKLHNCKQYFWIQPNGSSIAAAYFNPLEKSFREELIKDHYISHLCKTLRISIGYNVLKRDAPWDFRIGFSTGVTVNIEIISITDRPNFFQILTAEELVQRHSLYPTLRLGILRKIVKAFPDREAAELIELETASGKDNSDEVANPFYPGKPKVFLSLRPEPPLKLSSVIHDALVSKQRKKHDDKDQTILLIDNRTTTATLDEFIIAVQELQPLVDFLSFPEVWLYTGYGGVHPAKSNRVNKKYSEYLFLPLKLEPETYAKYRGLKL